MTPLSYSVKDYDTFIGIDVDKKSYVFSVGDHNTMSRAKKIPANPEHLHNYIQKQYKGKKVICAYEAGPTGFHLHDYLTERGIPCLVIPPLSIPKAPNEKVKNNQIDSTKITEELMGARAKAVRVPQGAYRELRYLVKTRQNYARDRKTARQRIKALLLYANLYPLINEYDIRWSAYYINKLKHLQCSFAVRRSLDMLLDDLEYTRKQTLSILKELKASCKDNPEIKKNMEYLQSVSGIGFITAVTFLARSGDPQYLRDEREAGAFAGLVPRENSTGDKINRGSITHLGDKTLRFLLVESAWVAIRKDMQLSQYYYRIKKRNNPKIAAKVAITAVARKLTQRMYRVLKDQRRYIVY
jgi:transposase